MDTKDCRCVNCTCTKNNNCGCFTPSGCKCTENHIDQKCPNIPNRYPSSEWKAQVDKSIIGDPDIGPVLPKFGEQIKLPEPKGGFPSSSPDLNNFNNTGGEPSG